MNSAELPEIASIRNHLAPTCVEDFGCIKLVRSFAIYRISRPTLSPQGTVLGPIAYFDPVWSLAVKSVAQFLCPNL